MKKIFALISLLALTACGNSNIHEVKAHADATWRQAGFEVIGYEGYDNARCFGSYGCGHAWYTLRRIPENGIVYHGFIEKWGDEYHIYNIRAIDAIKPQN